MNVDKLFVLGHFVSNRKQGVFREYIAVRYPNTLRFCLQPVDNMPEITRLPVDVYTLEELFEEYSDNNYFLDMDVERYTAS